MQSAGKSIRLISGRFILKSFVKMLLIFDTQELKAGLYKKVYLNDYLKWRV